MVYTPALEPYLKRNPGNLDVLEIEPQTMWAADHPINGPFSLYSPSLEAFQSHQAQSLVHSVGIPLGGTRKPNSNQLALLRDVAERLNSLWVSEHLSIAGTPQKSSGFLLPPLQTEAGIEVAVENIKLFKNGIGRPVAFETGVSYLVAKDFEMPDGQFVAQVAQEADCGILLDIHNIYCNECNGRESIESFMNRIPLDRVWEVHLAGGFELDGYTLDAHSGNMSNELIAIAENIISSLPNLGAINYEIYGTYLANIEDREISEIIDSLRCLWQKAGNDVCPKANLLENQPSEWKNRSEYDGYISPRNWENDLTGAILNIDSQLHKFKEDESAINLYSKLAISFRGSTLTRVAPRSIRYIVLRDDDNGDSFLHAYFKEVSPQIFGPLEVRSFRYWIRNKHKADIILNALLDYDIAIIGVSVTGKPITVKFPCDPSNIFSALNQNKIPEISIPQTWEVEILPN